MMRELSPRNIVGVEVIVEPRIRSKMKGLFLPTTLDLTKELAEIIIKLTDSSSEIVHLPALVDGDMTRRQPDITKMKKLLKRDLLPLEEGLKKLIKNTKYIL